MRTDPFPTPADSDIDDVMIAIKDIYGQEPAALWYWNRLQEIKANTDLNGQIKSAPDAGNDVGADAGGGGLIDAF